MFCISSAYSVSAFNQLSPAPENNIAMGDLYDQFSVDESMFLAGSDRIKKNNNKGTKSRKIVFDLWIN